ncbi:MAG: hypothetical protein P8L44_15320 [Opitutales bacterium]|jgi:hypothetical protein|nr:hypothetical protein [bacterium]MDG2169287.1 hypothetical protein [Opitutales bacterium]
MDKETIQLVRDALPEGRTVYYHFPDRYALLLLEQFVGESGKPISEIKNSPFASLLNKPCVKDVLAELGGKHLKAWDLRKAWPQIQDGYRLTLGTWPALDEKPQLNWHHITRSGWNLVLQLNFSLSHNRELQKTVGNWHRPLEWSPHPINKESEITLAWARIDLDLETGEALIEEIQSDWVRDVKDYAEKRWVDNHNDWKQYYEEIMHPKTKRWPETILTATLWFLLAELGIRQIFYHTADTGVKMKHIEWTPPPRSLYTALPKKFCFQKTHNGPQFIRDWKNRQLRKQFVDPDTTWFNLEFY